CCQVDDQPLEALGYILTTPTIGTRSPLGPVVKRQSTMGISCELSRDIEITIALSGHFVKRSLGIGY
ncbi:MAG TPA: hypothetical protein VN711_02180, partial [Candidatus Saccharimonadales bacterium]|nr:hypothetical protein [Candidatus Saccharimonadales bacterium]